MKKEFNIYDDPRKIYFIEASGSGLVKIGMTKRHVSRRQYLIQRDCPYPLKVLAVFPYSDLFNELNLWGMFSHLSCPNTWNQSSEWFVLNDEIRDLISANQTVFRA